MRELTFEEMSQVSGSSIIPILPVNLAYILGRYAWDNRQACIDYIANCLVIAGAFYYDLISS